MACTARDAAEKAGNQLDLTSALTVLASVLWLRGERAEAEACWLDTAARFERLGHPARAEKIRHALRQKSLLFPSPVG